MPSIPPSGAEEFLTGRFIASLGTENEGGSIHLTAVWYLFDAGCFYVATSSRSRKARNIAARPKASLMVDIRKPASERGLVAVCAADVIAGESLQKNQCSHPPSLYERGCIVRPARGRHHGGNGRHHPQADPHTLVCMGHAYTRRSRLWRSYENTRLSAPA